MFSMIGESVGTYPGAGKAAYVVLARSSSATTTVVRCTFVDVYVITTKA